ncbi:MAG: hypothetical protein Q8Q12_05630 [bacterium]|nr:hypothetical protein [bacterium]
MEKLSCPDLVKGWSEVKQKLTEALALTREILEAATWELAECEKRLNQSFTSVDGSLEKLGIDLRRNQERA